MATFTSIFVPGGPGSDASYTVAGTTAGATKTLGNRTIFAINATGDITIIFFNAANAKVPAATNFRIPANVVAVYDLSDYYDSYAVYNAGATTVTVYTQLLNRG